MTDARGSTTGRNDQEQRDDRRRDTQATRFNLGPPALAGQAYTLSAAALAAIQEQWDRAFPDDLAPTAMMV